MSPFWSLFTANIFAYRFGGGRRVSPVSGSLIYIYVNTYFRTSRVIDILGRFQLLCHVHCPPSSKRKFLSISIDKLMLGSSSYIKWLGSLVPYKILEGVSECDFWIEVEEERRHIWLLCIINFMFILLIAVCLIILLISRASLSVFIIEQVEALQERTAVIPLPLSCTLTCCLWLGIDWLLLLGI